MRGCFQPVRRESSLVSDAKLFANRSALFANDFASDTKLLPLMAYGSSFLSGLSTQAQIQSISAMSAALLITTSFRISSPV